MSHTFYRSLSAGVPLLRRAPPVPAATVRAVGVRCRVSRQLPSCRLRLQFGSFQLYPAFWFRGFVTWNSSLCRLFTIFIIFIVASFCSPKSNKLSEWDHQPGRKPIFIIFIILYILWDLLHFLVHLFRCFKQTGIWQQAPSSILSLLWSALERLKA